MYRIFGMPHARQNRLEFSYGPSTGFDLEIIFMDAVCFKQSTDLTLVKRRLQKFGLL